MGEEISMSARLWTSGYDIFSPTVNVLNHYYVRRHYPKFWESVNRWGKQILSMFHIGTICLIVVDSSSGLFTMTSCSWSSTESRICWAIPRPGRRCFILTPYCIGNWIGMSPQCKYTSLHILLSTSLIVYGLCSYRLSIP